MPINKINKIAVTENSYLQDIKVMKSLQVYKVSKIYENFVP